MKANRLSKDDSGADSSDAIIILALVLGVLLVLVYIGNSIGGWFTPVADWFGGIGETVQEGAENATVGYGKIYTERVVNPLASFWIWITGADYNTVEVEDDFLAEMYNADYFTLQNEENETDQLKGIFAGAEENTRRYTLTNETGRSAVEEIFRIRNAKTLITSSEFFEKVRVYELGESFNLKGEHYNATITVDRDDAEVEQYRLEITKA